MGNRKKTSGGQAIVMVSLALFSMAGMMGLAVDLGWSFFSQKAAQAAADDAALSAVQRAYTIIVAQEHYVSFFSFCGATGDVTCAPNPVSCDPTNHALGNLQSGCLYARNDGFVPGGHGGRQNVLIEANIPPTFPDSIPTSPGSPKDMVYWVTVRTYENIPQLFSSLMGHTQGAIAAVATAAIASKVLPGSFYGMNHQGDCFTANGTFYCGVDFVGGGGSGACPTGPSAFLCAPAGAFIASTCNGTAIANQCTGNSNYAGTGSMNGGLAIDIPIAKALDPSGTWTPAPTVTSTVGYQDPTQGEPQPPLAASTAVPSCGVKSIPSNATLGPFQYYHYINLKNGLPDPDGAPIVLPSDTTFAANGTCPGVVSSTGTDQSSSAFPMYVFYGGLSTGQNTVTFGAGQYVMAGVTGANNAVFNADKSDLITAGANGNNYAGTGNLFIVTNQNYPGMSTQLTTVPNNTDAIPNLQFGSTYFKGGNGNTGSDLFGITNNAGTGTSDLPDNLNGYGGILFWQDRGNSTVTYDANGKVTSQTNPSCPAASCTSPELLLDHGHNNLQNLHGLLYQPRGAWTRLASGGGNLSTSPLQLLTGAVIGSSGADYVQLMSPTSPAIRYLPVLIQ
jgi:hypothetical protein